MIRIRNNPSQIIKKDIPHPFYFPKPIAKKTKQRSSPYLSKTIMCIKDLSCSDSESEQDPENKIFYSKEFHNEIYENILKDLIVQFLLPVVKESIKDMTSASIILYINSIMDQYIKEALNVEILKVAKIAIDEIKNTEFIDISDEWIKDICLFEIGFIIGISVNEVLSENICFDYISGLQIFDIVEESLSEELKSHSSIVDTFGNKLINYLLEEDWLEILVEDEISFARLNENYKLMPVNLQKTLACNSMSKSLENVIESIYFDFLNEFVAGIWTENVVLCCVNEKDVQNNEKMMPLFSLIKDKRKNISSLAVLATYKLIKSIT